MRRFTLKEVVIATAVCGVPLSTSADVIIHPFNDPAFNFTIGPQILIT